MLNTRPVPWNTVAELLASPPVLSTVVVGFSNRDNCDSLSEMKAFTSSPPPGCLKETGRLSCAVQKEKFSVACAAKMQLEDESPSDSHHSL